MPTEPLTPERLRDLSDWRALALEAMPYMASTLMALRPVAAPGLGTFAVDGGFRLYVDFDAVREWGPLVCSEALLHECSHLLADHKGQADSLGIGQTDHRAWNLAADLSINDDLRDAGCTSFADDGPFVLPRQIGAPDYLTPKEYFDLLPRTGARAPATGEPFSGCGSGSGAEPAPCELGDDDMFGHAPAASGSEATRVRVATATAIAEAAARGRGSVPSGLVAISEGVLTPSRTPWQQVLGRLVRGAVRAAAGGDQSTYARRSARRHDERILTPAGPGRRIVHPGTITPLPSIVVVRDTSGSMGDAELAAVTSEVEAISRRLRVRGEDLVVLDVDADVHAARRYTGARSLREVAGRGGTDMCAGIAWALSLPRKPSAVVVITDGMTPWPPVQATRKTRVLACLVGPDAAQHVAGVPSWIRSVLAEV